MKANVSDDDTRRTIRIKLEDVPEQVSLGSCWGTRGSGHRFVPDMLVVELLNGTVTTVKLMGQRVLKSGELSENSREYSEWRGPGYLASRTLESAATPEWVRTLVQEAQQNVTRWVIQDPEATP